MGGVDRVPGCHDRKPGFKRRTGSFPVYTHTVPCTPALYNCPISMGLCLVTSWRIMPMQAGIDLGTGCGPEPLHCGVHLSPRGEIAGTGLPFQPGQPVGAGAAHQWWPVVRAQRTSAATATRPASGWR